MLNDQDHTNEQADSQEDRALDLSQPLADPSSLNSARLSGALMTLVKLGFQFGGYPGDEPDDREIGYLNEPHASVQEARRKKFVREVQKASRIVQTLLSTPATRKLLDEVFEDDRGMTVVTFIREVTAQTPRYNQARKTRRTLRYDFGWGNHTSYIRRAERFGQAVALLLAHTDLRIEVNTVSGNYHACNYVTIFLPHGFRFVEPEDFNAAKAAAFRAYHETDESPYDGDSASTEEDAARLSNAELTQRARSYGLRVSGVPYNGLLARVRMFENHERTCRRMSRADLAQKLENEEIDVQLIDDGYEGLSTYVAYARAWAVIMTAEEEPGIFDRDLLPQELADYLSECDLD